MASPLDLQLQAVEILNASIQALDTIPLSDPALEGAPDRAFVSPALPAIECCPGGQLTVHVASVSDAPIESGLRMGKLAAGKRTHVLFVVTIARCVLDERQGMLAGLDDPLNAADQQETADQTNTDIWALWNHLYNLWRSELLFTLCSEVFFEGAFPLPESGGCAGWTLALRTILDGYPEALST